MRNAILTTALVAAFVTSGHAGPAPAFSLRSLDGSVFDSQDAVGQRIVLVEFWATWCEPCVKYLKKLQEIQDKHPEVLVLAISIDDSGSQAKVAQLVRGRGYTFSVLLDPDTSVCRLFNPEGGVPFTLVIDRDGELAYTRAGYLPGQEKKLVEKLETLRK